MIDLLKLKVRPGDPVWPAWERLLNWARQFRPITSPGILLTQTPQGTYVVADVAAASWAHPFKVGLTGDGATITKGQVEGIVPRIGKVALDAETAPVLKIAGKPNADGVSWIALEVKTEGAKIAENKPENVQIKHMTTLARTVDETGIQPIALLRWSAGVPSSVFQIVHHNLGHLYIKPTETRGSRHLFWAK
ncbi:hypothetical protein EBZ39_02950 [bacterium]|nr:hypothetical protein [bacterium]